jgi:hypothetical protein
VRARRSTAERLSEGTHRKAASQIDGECAPPHYCAAQRRPAAAACLAYVADGVGAAVRTRRHDDPDAGRQPFAGGGATDGRGTGCRRRRGRQRRPAARGRLATTDCAGICFEVWLLERDLGLVPGEQLRAVEVSGTVQGRRLTSALWTPVEYVPVCAR